jgi:diguanylate cyclase (GGDEF)-like protein/PAS domain S-box-containing protein
MPKKMIDQAELRRQAEARLAAPAMAGSNGHTDKLLHELEVYQIELDMQNEELRRAMITLEEARDRYLDLNEFSPTGYLTLNGSGQISEANLTAAELLGEERDEWHRKILHIVLNGGMARCALNLERGDGVRFPCRIDCVSRAAEDGLPWVRIALTDISDLKQAEEEARIAATAFEIQGCTVVTDANGIIVRVNPAFTRVTGYSAEEAVGNTLALLKSDRHEAAFFRDLWTHLKSEKTWRGEVWTRHKNGEIYAEWLTLTAVTTPEGETTHYVGTLSVITLNDEAEAEIHRLAYYDPLTRLPNRRLLLDLLGRAQAVSTRTGRYGAVLFLDLDGFKLINDGFGHDVGDRLLIEVTRRLHEAVREGDSLARLGGDEFVLVLENLDTEAAEAAIQARQVGEKVRESLARLYQINGGEFHCSAIIGIALLHGHDVPVETLLKHADLALYQAKGALGNCVHFYDPAMQAALNERKSLEADLRLALKRGQLQLYYQAQFDRARHVIGAEALLRWPHPKRGMVAPNDFLPVAEDSGLIHAIGQWVLNTACAQLHAWSTEADSRDLTLTVNVSSRQFHHTAFVDEVRQALKASGADPSRLKIEVTEHLVTADMAATSAKMRELKAIGIGFSMDDFGTGHSLLSHLRQLPFEQLKIDRAFLTDLSTDDHNAAIVQTLITLGRAMGLKVVAEGVETDAQMDYLDQHDCATFQGNIFSLPLPADKFRKLLNLPAENHLKSKYKHQRGTPPLRPLINPDARSRAA